MILHRDSHDSPLESPISLPHANAHAPLFDFSFSHRWSKDFLVYPAPSPYDGEGALRLKPNLPSSLFTVKALTASAEAALGV